MKMVSMSFNLNLSDGEKIPYAKTMLAFWNSVLGKTINWEKTARDRVVRYRYLLNKWEKEK